MQALPDNFVADRFLGGDPDCPVFGLNLACAWPFPASVKEQYESMAASLAQLDANVYVYPWSETHITLMTFLNFSLAQRPSPEERQNLQSCIAPLAELIELRPIQPFQLEAQRPVLTPKAAILPITNATGEIAQIRRQVTTALTQNPGLQSRLIRGGLNVPEIIHSTIMRFKRPPRDATHFRQGFQRAAASALPFTITVPEIYLTSETKPYMRAGEIVHCFRL